MKEILLSIIIPSYNADKYIDDCLESVVKQKLPDNSSIEVIFIDDGSTDKTSEVVERYSNIQYVKFYKKSNSGVSLTRNFGVEQSHGDYILFLDSDDKIAENGLYKLISLLKQHHVDIVYFSGSVFYESDNLNSFKPVYIRDASLCDKVVSGKDFFINSVAKGIFFVQPCMYVFKRELFTGNEFIPGILHEDNPFTVNLLLHRNNSVYCIPEQIYLRRVRNNSIMTSELKDENAEGYLDSIKNIHDKYYVFNNDVDLKKSVRIFMFKLIRCGIDISIKIKSKYYLEQFELFYQNLNPNAIEKMKFNRPAIYRIYEKIFKINRQY